MILTLKNIGKIDEAEIILNGVTVIAGENNTGKSTLGKALFCIFNSFYKIEQQIYKERKNAIRRILEIPKESSIGRSVRRVNLEDMAESIIQKQSEYTDNDKLLKEDIKELYFKFSEYIDKDEISSKILQILSVSDNEILKTVLQKRLDSEFNSQITNIYFPNKEGNMCLNIKDSKIIISIKDGEVNKITDSINLNTEVLYIDDPLALDDDTMFYYLLNNYYTSHRDHLKSKLVNAPNREGDLINEIIKTKKLDNIVKKLNTVCSGEMIKTKGLRFGYKNDSSNMILDIKNISTGLKTFVILKTLLINGSLEDNGTIVLDEPEIHLHPEWQLVFAELIVLIQKEFNMHILLNTHSPYFLNAIEVYAAKYGIASKCKYYLAENLNTKSIITDVSDNIEKIYEKLARPLQDLENERYRYD